MTVIEVLSFTVSETYLANPGISQELYEMTKGEEGFRGVHYGMEIENPKTVWFFVEWESYEHHQKAQKGPNAAEISATLRTCIAGDVKLLHATFLQDPHPAFAAPVTEIVTIKRNSGASKDELEGYLNDLIRSGDETPQGMQYGPFAYGRSREEPDTYFFLGGWENIEHHIKTSADPKATKPFIEKIFLLAECTIVHAPLTDGAALSSSQQSGV